MGTAAIISLIFAILGTAASIGTGIWSNQQNRQINQENNQLAQETREDSQNFAREQQTTANNATVQMFNAMDSPKARARQIKDAGLSVGLMYGNGGGNGGSHASALGSAPSAPLGISAPFINPVVDLATNPMDAFKEIADAELKGKQGNLAEKQAKKTDYDINETIANTKKIEEEAKTQVVTRNYTETQNKLAELQLNFENASFEDKLEIISSERELIRNNILKTQREIRSLEISNEYSGKLYQSTLDLNTELKNKYIAEQAYIAAQEELAKAQEALAYAQSKKADKEVEQIGLEMRKLKVIVEEYEANGYKATEANGFVDNAIGAAKHTHATIQKYKEEYEWKWEGDDFYNRKGEALKFKNRKGSGQGITGGGGAKW